MKVVAEVADVDVEEAVRIEVEDRRRKPYKRKVSLLAEKKQKQIKRTKKTLEKLFRSTDYKNYDKDKSQVPKSVLAQNRDLLFDTIRNSNVPQDRLIIVTHERMYRIAEEGVSPLLHIYGHIHEYKFGSFKGTCYLNAAAIDNGFSGLFGRREILPEGYCGVVIADGEVSVTRKLLFESGRHGNPG